MPYDRASEFSWEARAGNNGRFAPGDNDTFITSNGSTVFQFDDSASLFEGPGNSSFARGGNGGNGGGGGKPDKGGNDGGFNPVDYTSGPADGYNVTIVFEGDGWTQELYDAFIYAADLLSTIITEDRPDYEYQKGPGSKGLPRHNIDDLEITATIGFIDGPGAILGQAGPQYIISADGGVNDPYLPFAGIMEFDTADALQLLADGNWANVVLHEMLHVAGIGTMWEYNGVVTTVVDDKGTESELDDEVIGYTYNGQALDPGGQKPEVEEDGGSGTAGGHWDEGTDGDPSDPGYGGELMTGYIGNEPVYVADMTWQTLADLGYEIIADYSAFVGDIDYSQDDGFSFA